jgi:ParB/RepB/Spo0J family partition protein
MADLNFPTDTFDREITIGSAKKAQTATGAKTGTVYKVPVDQIHVMDDLNVRVTGSKDYNDHLAYLRESIRNNGFMPDKPLSVFVQKTEDGDDIFVVADGHSRLAAVRALIEDGVEGLSTIPVIVKAEGTDTRDILLGLINSNSGKDLNAYEKAVVVKRLAGLGMEYDEIANKIGLGVKMVRNYLKVMAAPEKLRKLIVQGSLSLSAALKLLQEHGAEAGAVAEGAAENAEASGNTTIRPSRDVRRTKKAVVKLDYKFKAGTVYGADDPGVVVARFLLDKTELTDLLKKVKGGFRANESFKVFASVSHDEAAAEGEGGEGESTEGGDGESTEGGEGESTEGGDGENTEGGDGYGIELDTSGL